MEPTNRSQPIASCVHLLTNTNIQHAYFRVALLFEKQSSAMIDLRLVKVWGSILCCYLFTRLHAHTRTQSHTHILSHTHTHKHTHSLKHTNTHTKAHTHQVTNTRVHIHTKFHTQLTMCKGTLSKIYVHTLVLFACKKLNETKTTVDLWIEFCSQA